jgi:uncharacterized protein
LALYFLDTSALVKLYVVEAGTDMMLRLADAGAANDFGILSIAAVEFRSALRRRQREGDISAASADAILISLASDIETKFLQQPITDALIQSALDVVDRYMLRAYDSLQLAGCIALRYGTTEEPVFVCSDRALTEAARSEGLRLLDPTEA